MYLHVGNNRNIRVREIVGIFDADTATVAAVTKKYLSAAQAADAVEFASVELPKSFVIYRVEKRPARTGIGSRRLRGREQDDYRVCFSQLSSASLAGRVETGINA